MDSVLKTVDSELGVDEGPYFLGGDISLVDIMFTPFLERMSASLPYFKGFESRTPRYPNLLRWYSAMDSRPTYRGLKSDYYTHCKDLPPQIGKCWMREGTAQKFAAEIDGFGGAGSGLEPMIPEDPDLARREVVRRVLDNHENIARFAARGEVVNKEGRGFGAVSAELADPGLSSTDETSKAVSVALRYILSLLLTGEAAVEGVPGPAKCETKSDATVSLVALSASLVYLRDRIGVPRDMSVHAAYQFRAAINYTLKKIV